MFKMTKTQTEHEFENLIGGQIFAIDNSVCGSTKLDKPSRGAISHEEASTEEAVLTDFRHSGGIAVAFEMGHSSAQES